MGLGCGGRQGTRACDVCLGAPWRGEAGQEPWCFVGNLYIWDSLSPLGSPTAGLGHWTHALQMMLDDRAVEPRSLSMSGIHALAHTKDASTSMTETQTQ